MQKQILILLYCSILYACGTIKTHEENIFRFNYDGNIYEIVSMSLPDRVDYNLLQRYNDDGELIFQARDDDSNGRLDRLLFGDITLESANEIYFIGIDDAIYGGQFESKSELRRFEIVRTDGIYIIETFGFDELTSSRRMVYGFMAPVNIYNEFTIYYSDGNNKIAFRDLDSDGILNSEHENRPTIEYQEKYKELLETGIQEGKIRKVRDMYVVQTVN